MLAHCFMVRKHGISGPVPNEFWDLALTQCTPNIPLPNTPGMLAPLLHQSVGLWVCSTPPLVRTSLHQNDTRCCFCTFWIAPEHATTIANGEGCGSARHAGVAAAPTPTEEDSEITELPQKVTRTTSSVKRHVPGGGLEAQPQAAEEPSAPGGGPVDDKAQAAGGGATC